MRWTNLQDSTSPGQPHIRRGNVEEDIRDDNDSDEVSVHFEADEPYRDNFELSPYSASIGEREGSAYVAVNADTGAPAKVVNLEKTARFMFARSVRRRINGHYKRKTKMTQIACIVITVVLFMSLIGAGVSIYFPVTSSERTATLSAEQWSSLVVVASFFFILFFVVKLSLLIRWCFYWLVFAVVILIIINKGHLTPESSHEAENQPVTFKTIFNDGNAPTIAVIITLLAVEILTLCGTLFHRVIYPHVIISETSYLSTLKWWKIRPVQSQPGTFQYKTWDWWSISNENHTFSYSGTVDPDGSPHGYGEWCDDAESGELIKGYWKNGRPIAPFKAREFGSGDSFSAVKVGFATCSKLGMNEYRFFPVLDDNGVRYGVAGVECSVSGKFFAELPEVTFTFPATYRHKIVTGDLERGSIRRPMDSVLYELNNRDFGGYGSIDGPVVLEPNGGDMLLRGARGSLNIASLSEVAKLDRPSSFQCENGNADEGHITVFLDHCTNLPSVLNFSKTGIATDPSSVVVRCTQDSTSGKRKLHVDDWTKNMNGHEPAKVVPGLTDRLNRSCRAEEAFIFLHGYNCSVEAALERFGQLLSLGDFPPWIKPFVFGWPPGVALSYFQAARAGVDPVVRNAFVTFIQDLSRSGIRRIHILSHSAGCKVIVSFASVFQDIFTSIMEDDPLLEQPNAKNAARAEDAGVPKVRLVSFTLMNPDVPLAKFLEADFILLRRYCDLITTYADANDGALYFAEQFGRQKVVGRNPGLLYTVVPKCAASNQQATDDLPGVAQDGTDETQSNGTEYSDDDPRSVAPTTSNATHLLRGSSQENVSKSQSEVRRINSLGSTRSIRRTSSIRSGFTGAGFIEANRRHSRKRRTMGMKMKLFVRPKFGSQHSFLNFQRGPSSAAEGIDESVDLQMRSLKLRKRKLKERRREEELIVEMKRLRSLLQGRESYAREVADRNVLAGLTSTTRMSDLVYPDMDTIDTSLLDVNIHSIRHNYLISTDYWWMICWTSLYLESVRTNAALGLVRAFKEDWCSNFYVPLLTL